MSLTLPIFSIFPLLLLIFFPLPQQLLFLEDLFIVEDLEIIYLIDYHQLNFLDCKIFVLLKYEIQRSQKDGFVINVMKIFEIFMPNHLFGSNSLLWIILKQFLNKVNQILVLVLEIFESSLSHFAFQRFYKLPCLLILDAFHLLFCGLSKLIRYRFYLLNVIDTCEIRFSVYQFNNRASQTSQINCC